MNQVQPTKSTMKKILSVLSVLLAVASGNASAQTILLDFGSVATVAAPYLSTSPGHAIGGVSGTTWNQVSTSADVTSATLLDANGGATTGITVDMGQAAVGTNLVNFATAITNTGLVGTGGGTAGQQSLLGLGSVYGDDGTSTAAGRDGFFGGGSGAAGSAVGLRIDGLAVGDYVIYVMARNTNSNATVNTAMNIFSAVGASAATFDFTSLSATTQANTTYTTAAYAGEYTAFTAGEEYVALNVTIGSGQSLFLAIDGASTGETRGFMNSIEIVQVPEPSTYALLVGAVLLFLVVRRKRGAVEV
jgi:hypothetical protein